MRNKSGRGIGIVWKAIVVAVMLLALTWGGEKISVMASTMDAGVMPASTPATTASPSAISAGGECTPLDLVLLIDQSDSMRYNDPENFRIIVMRHLLQILLTDLETTCPTTSYQVAVVEFGDEAHTALGPVNLAQFKGENLTKSLDNLEKYFSEHGFSETDMPHYLGRTNHGAAFEEAARDLTLMAEGHPTGKAKQAVILLTDGWPCVGSWGCSIQDDHMDRQAYMQYLISDVIPQIPDDAQIWIVALNDKTPYLKTVGSAFAQIAESHGGKLIDLPYNKTMVPIKVHEVFSKITGRREQQVGCGDPLYIPPYLGMVTLYIYKDSRISTEVQLGAGYRLQGGKSVGDKDAVAFSGLIDYHLDKGGASEIYRFFAPPAGVWQIVSAQGGCKNLEATLQAVDEERGLFDLQVFDARGNVLTGQAFVWPQCRNCDANHSDPHNPLKPSISIRFAFQGGGPGENISAFIEQWRGVWPHSDACALNLSAVVTAPDGTKYKIPLVADKQNLRLWHFVKPLPVDQGATREHPYQVSFEGIGPSITAVHEEEGKIQSVCDLKHPIEVLKETPPLFSYVTVGVPVVHLQMVEPKPGSRVPVWRAVSLFKLVQPPVDVKLQVIDEQGKVVPLAEVFGEAGEGVSAKVVSQKEGEEDLPLRLEGNAYVGQIAFRSGWGGKVCVHAKVNGYNRSKYFFSKEEERFCFSRVQPLYWLVFYGKWIVLLLILFVMVSYWIFIIQPFRGQLLLTHNGKTTFVDLNVGRLRLFPTISRRVPADAALPVEKVIVEHAGPNKITVHLKGEIEDSVILSPNEEAYANQLRLKWVAGGSSVPGGMDSNMEWGGTTLSSEEDDWY